MNKKKVVVWVMIAILIALIAYASAQNAQTTADLNNVFEVVVNNTNLAPTIEITMPGTGERVTGVNYTNSLYPIEILLYAHAQAVSQTSDIRLFINGTMVSSVSSKPVGASPEQNNKSIVAIIPKGSIYSVDFQNYHHYEWREYPILSGKNGTLSINNTYNNATDHFNEIFVNIVSKNDTSVNDTILINSSMIKVLLSPFFLSSINEQSGFGITDIGSESTSRMFSGVGDNGTFTLHNTNGSVFIQNDVGNSTNISDLFQYPTYLYYQIDGNEKVNIGATQTTITDSTFLIRNTTFSSGLSSVLEGYQSGTGSLTYGSRKSRGTYNSPSKIISGDALLAFDGYGRNDGLTTPWSRGGLILLFAKATPANNDQYVHSQWIFRASKDGTTYPDDIIVADGDGNVSLPTGYSGTGNAFISADSNGKLQRWTKEGANAKQGTAVCISPAGGGDGYVVVSNTGVTATSRIFVSPQNGSVSSGVYSRNVSSNFTLFCNDDEGAGHTTLLAWLIMEVG